MALRAEKQLQLCGRRRCVNGVLLWCPIGRGLQRLTRSERRRILSVGIPLALATHRDLTRPLERAGYHVRSVHVAGRLSRAQIRSAFQRRIELARLGPGPLPTLTAADVAQLVRRYGHNLRAMEDHLYDEFQAPKDTWRAEMSVDH